MNAGKEIKCWNILPMCGNHAVKVNHHFSFAVNGVNGHDGSWVRLTVTDFSPDFLREESIDKDYPMK
jgi:hypothetical protein